MIWEVVASLFSRLSGLPYWAALIALALLGAKPLWRWRKAVIVRADTQVAQDMVAKLKAERELEGLSRKVRRKKGADIEA